MTEIPEHLRKRAEEAKAKAAAKAAGGGDAAPAAAPEPAVAATSAASCAGAGLLCCRPVGAENSITHGTCTLTYVDLRTESRRCMC